MILPSHMIGPNAVGSLIHLTRTVGNLRVGTELGSKPLPAGAAHLNNNVMTRCTAAIALVELGLKQTLGFIITSSSRAPHWLCSSTSGIPLCTDPWGVLWDDEPSIILDVCGTRPGMTSPQSRVVFTFGTSHPPSPPAYPTSIHCSMFQPSSSLSDEVPVLIGYSCFHTSHDITPEQVVFNTSSPLGRPNLAKRRLKMRVPGPG